MPRGGGEDGFVDVGDAAVVGVQGGFAEELLEGKEGEYCGHVRMGVT